MSVKLLELSPKKINFLSIFLITVIDMSEKLKFGLISEFRLTAIGHCALVFTPLTTGISHG